MTDRAHERQALEGLRRRIDRAITDWRTAPAGLLGALGAARDALERDTPPFDAIYSELEAAWAWTQAHA